MSQFAQDDQPRAVRADIIKLYLDTLFAHVDWSQGGRVALLGVGEKGSSGEGGFMERQFVDMRTPFYASVTTAHAQRWADHGRGAFIVPAVVKDGGEHDDVRLDKIMAITSVCVDIDSGDVDAKVNYVCQHLGRPTLAVRSGGVTESGHAKAHLYWVLSEPETEVEEVGRVRKLLAAKVGGDWSFGRATQVIRLPGSIHAKNGQAKPVTMGTPDLGREWHFDEIRQAIEDMPAMPGVEVAPDVVRLPVEPVRLPNGAWDFSAATGMPWPESRTAEVERIAAMPVIEPECASGIPSWDAFGKVAGTVLAATRGKPLPEGVAYEVVKSWAREREGWDDSRIDSNWQGLVRKDLKEKGPIAAPVSREQAFRLETLQSSFADIVGATQEPLESVDDLLSWAVHLRSSENPPERVDIVKDMIAAGQRHIVVAEGGAGKTNSTLELSLKIAASREGENPLSWLGQPMTEYANHMTAIMFTAEDNRASLDRRWAKIDPGMVLRRRAGDRLIVLPMENTGHFKLTQRDPKTGVVVPSDEWGKRLKLMAGLVERGHQIGVVTIDTMNSTLDGEESAPIDIADYMQALSMVTAGFGAAAILNHHVRKPKDGKRIMDGDDMLDAIRGSAAIKDNVRVAIGIWRAPDYKKRLRMMGLPLVDKRLYCCEIVKMNEPMHDTTKYLLRNDGVLQDCTTALANRVDTLALEQKLWIMHAIEEYAEQGFFFNKNGANGIFNQRTMLHPMFHPMDKNRGEGITRQELFALMDSLESQGLVQTRTLEGSGSSQKVWYDIADAPEARVVAPKGATITKLNYALLRCDVGALRIDQVDDGWSEKPEQL